MERVDLRYCRRGDKKDERTESILFKFSLFDITAQRFWESCENVEQVGKTVAKHLYAGVPSQRPPYNQITVFRSMDDKVKDESGNPIKPYLQATTEAVLVIGAVSDEDDLFKMQKACLRQLRKRR